MKMEPEQSKPREITFLVPHILKSITQDEEGFLHREIREGGSRQVELEGVTEFATEAVEETPFVIKATNQVNFGGSVINVINDEVELKGYRLVPTAPTASEYLKKVGEKTMIMFHCRPDPERTKELRKEKSNEDKTVYRIFRGWITLP